MCWTMSVPFENFAPCEFWAGEYLIINKQERAHDFDQTFTTSWNEINRFRNNLEEVNPLSFLSRKERSMLPSNTHILECIKGTYWNKDNMVRWSKGTSLVPAPPLRVKLEQGLQAGLMNPAFQMLIRLWSHVLNNVCAIWELCSMWILNRGIYDH